MKRTYLGEFEEIVLLTIAILGEHAYGVKIKEEIDQQTGRSISISAIHATLHRLRKRGSSTPTWEELLLNGEAAENGFSR